VDLDGAPDAGAGKGWTPVPAEVAGLLAQERSDRAEGARARAEPVTLAFTGRDGSLQGQSQVGAAAAQFGNVDAPRTVHVATSPARDLVDEDFGEGVDAEEHELDTFGIRSRDRGQRRRVLPVGASDPRDDALVVIDDGIRDRSRIAQCGVNVAGYRRGELVSDDIVGHRSSQRAQSPRLVDGVSSEHH
jgi:hypothetical protein